MDEKSTSFNKYTGPNKKKTRRKAKSKGVQYAPVRYITGKAYERMLRNGE